MGFEFQIVTTEDCNLACEYCYINQQPNNMTNEIFDKHFKMLPKIMDFYGQHEYTAALFGGEPLLNWELIEYIIPILKNDSHCKFIIAMTNGLVLQDDYKRQYIDDNQIALSLSFDGLWNEKNRKLKHGGSSLDLYLTEPLKSYFFGRGGGCKVMVSPDCVPTMVDNFKWFVEELNVNNPDFTLVRDDIWTDYDVANYEIECHLLANQVIKYYNEGINANVGFFQLYTLDLLFGKSFGKRPFGCFAGTGGAGFMPNGDIYPCARFGSCKEKKIGNSFNQEFTKEIQLLRNPNLINPKTFKKCLECELYKYCNGGCMNSQLKNSSSPEEYAEPIDNLCKILKITYKNTMRITKELKENKMFKETLINSIKNVG